MRLMTSARRLGLRRQGVARAGDTVVGCRHEHINLFASRFGTRVPAHYVRKQQGDPSKDRPDKLHRSLPPRARLAGPQQVMVRGNPRWTWQHHGSDHHKGQPPASTLPQADQASPALSPALRTRSPTTRCSSVVLQKHRLALPRLPERAKLRPAPPPVPPHRRC